MLSKDYNSQGALVRLSGATKEHRPTALLEYEEDPRLSVSQPWARIITLCSRSLATQRMPRSRRRKLEWGLGFHGVSEQVPPSSFPNPASSTARASKAILAAFTSYILCPVFGLCQAPRLEIWIS